MPNRNKTKGNTAERELAKKFAEKFGGSWLRTPTSGAITGKSNSWRAATMSKSQLLTATNDITPPDEYTKCALESKFYKDFEFHHAYRPEGIVILNDWIDQVFESGIDMNNSFPLICFKINRKGWFVCAWKDKISDFDLSKIQYTNYTYKSIQYIITSLDIFLDTYNQELKNKFA